MSYLLMSGWSKRVRKTHFRNDHDAWSWHNHPVSHPAHLCGMYLKFTRALFFSGDRVVVSLSYLSDKNSATKYPVLGNRWENVRGEASGGCQGRLGLGFQSLAARASSYRRQHRNHTTTPNERIKRQKGTARLQRPRLVLFSHANALA